MHKLRALFLFLNLGLIQLAQADHLMGGEITWSCSSTNNYIFTLTLYGDCNGALALFGNSSTINSNSSAGNITVTKISEVDVSPDCYDPLLGITCQQAINSNTTYIDGAVKKYTYRSAPIAMNGIPPIGGWTFSWTSCCRPNGLQNAPNPGGLGYFLRTKMYPYAPPGGAPLNTSTCYDSSPLFAENGSPTICAGYPFTYNHLAADKDLDSLSFKWDNPQVSATQAMPWSTGYSNTIPFPDASEAVSNGPVSLDPVSGEMLMEVNSFGSSSAQGTFASCIKVEAWRDCQLIAEVYRDVALTILSGCPVNNIPDADIDTSIYKDITRSGKTYRTSIYPGDTLKFEFFAKDFDFLPNGSPQDIIFEAGGLQVSSPLTSGLGCLGAGSCAKFTPVSPQSGFTQGLQNNIQFEWTPDCSHLGTILNGCGGVTSTYYFTLKMSDNSCPAPGVSISTLIVDVIPGDPTPPDLGCVFVTDANNAEFSWSKSLQDSSLGFNFYSILGAPTLNGAYDTLKKIYPIDSLFVPLNITGYQYFYMVKSTGLCNFFSRTSDTLGLMNLNLTSIPPSPNSQVASLTWTPLRTPLPITSAGVYEIWRGIGSNNWQKIGETTSLNFNDTVNVCNEIVDYQIRVVDTAKNCNSSSTIASGIFSDRVNPDLILFDSITVNSNGQAEFSWNPSTSSDVVAYYILYNDPINGWIYVDTVSLNEPLPYSWPNSMAGQNLEAFKIISVDSCDNKSDVLLSPTHTTMYLRNKIDPCEGNATLRWSPYEGFANGISAYNLYVKIDDGTGFKPPILLYTGGSMDSVFIHQNLKVDYEYCYFVRAFNSDTTRSSTSNEVCIIGNIPQASRLLYLARVTNNYVRESIDLRIFIDGEADVEQYFIERSTEKNGIYKLMGSIPKPNAPPYVLSFQDFSADPQSIYYYRVKSLNLCGGIDTLSALGNNIKLEVEAKENVSNHLRWNSYGNWGGGVGRYDIYRSIGSPNNYQLLGNNDGQDTTYIDKLDGDAKITSRAFYYIQAVEDNNPLGFLDENGETFKSLSNQAFVNQKTKVYIPTAFKPSSNIEANRTFGPSIQFMNPEEYQFNILNRWGTVVFQTTDPSEFWDGKIEGKEAPTGVYTYYLKFSSLSSIPQEEKGSFTLLY